MKPWKSISCNRLLVGILKVGALYVFTSFLYQPQKELAGHFIISPFSIDFESGQKYKSADPEVC